MFKTPVDAVITWVDGQDKAHAEKLACYRMQIQGHGSEAVAPTRFNQCGEIDYCVRSLLHFAPWIRTIYILTDAQTPGIVKELVGTPHEHKVKVVDHRDVFVGLEEYLPTFNSITIETLLWRIPGLSDRFIYLNDDCALIRPLAYEDFFRGDYTVLRGRWRTHSHRQWRHRIKRWLPSVLASSRWFAKQDTYRTVQENSAVLAGLDCSFFQLPHAPFPLKKQTFDDFFAANPEALTQNIRYAFRHPDQFWMISLALHLEIIRKRVVFDNALEGVTVNGAYHSLTKIKRRLAYARNNQRVAFVCMQSIDAASNEIQRYMLKWLACSQET